jgi:hypothetical protein
MACIYKACETFYPFKISILYSLSDDPGYGSCGCCDAQQQKTRILVEPVIRKTLSRINNLDLRQTHDYKALGIVGEPYLDVDFTQVFYLTDTGRRWNHAGAGIRDRVGSGFDIRVNSTGHLMALAREGRLPERVMINTHPQRWEDRALPWVKELVWQNVKNGVKKIVLSFVFQKREKNLRFFDVTYSPPIPV